MSLTQLLVPTFTQMLNTLSGLLKKAEGQFSEAEAEALLSARLAPDMYPLSTQVRFACLQVQEAVYRLQQKARPDSVEVLGNEGRNAGEQPGSLSQAQDRIRESIALLEGLAANALDIDADTPIAIELAAGMTLDLTAEQYARDWALAQFYFHLMSAYAILRNNGAELGKADYVPHMLAYLRPEGAPGG